MMIWVLSVLLISVTSSAVVQVNMTQQLHHAAGRALPLRSPAPYQMQMQQRSVLSSPARTAGNGAGSGGFSGSANLAERDEALVGRTIKVMKGPYK